MKTTLLAGLFVYATLFVVTTFVPWEEARQQAAAAGFSETDIDNGLEYEFRWNLLYWTRVGVHYLFYFLVIFKGWGRWLAETFHARSGGRWFVTVLLMLVFFFLANALLALPFGAMGFELQRAWGMTERPWGDWLRDRALSFALNTFIWGSVFGGLYLLIRYFPRTWWLGATLFGLVFGIGYAIVQPLVIAPLFNTFTPLRDTEWKNLEKSVRALTDKAGIEVNEILVMNASRQGFHSNAYFAGFGPTRRIVLYDNLLKQNEPDEIESVLAHEIGHWQYDHIVKGIALAVPAVLLALYALSWILRWSVNRRPLLLTSPADPAGIPLVLILYSLGTWLAMPVENAVSRHFESQANQAALDLAEKPKAFINVEKNMAKKNLSNVAPTPWNAWLFGTHPTTIEAIRMAEDWRLQNQRKK
jgi:STE24 endopeptidase